MPQAKSRPNPTLLLTALAIGACSGARAGGRDTRRFDVSHPNDETTLVSIDDTASRTENSDCLRYCARLAECWTMMPGADVTMTNGEVQSQCQKEQAGCRTPTTETFCCERESTCADFSQCQTKSRDVVMDCSRRSVSTGLRR